METSYKKSIGKEKKFQIEKSNKKDHSKAKVSSKTIE